MKNKTLELAPYTTAISLKPHCLTIQFIKQRSKLMDEAVPIFAERNMQKKN